jgi:hypothetical protein
MNKRQLQEIAKFLSGAVAADIITMVWVAQMGLLPLQAFGMTITSDMLLPAFMFDVALLVVLIHFGWHVGKIPLPRERGYLLIASILFIIIAVAHLTRLFTSAEITVVGWQVPLWLSWLGVIVTTYLAYASVRFAARIK